MAEKQAYARRVAYLGSPDKILAALANEFGATVPLPSRKFVETILKIRTKQNTITRMRQRTVSERFRFQGSIKE